MDLSFADDLVLGHARLTCERAIVSPPERAVAAEALQRLLWTHREGIVDAVNGALDARDHISALTAALRPFARCDQLLATGQNAVILSLPAPADGGPTYVQLRGADFHQAARLWEAHRG